MPLFRRADGALARDLPPFRRMMPFLMRTRNESAVYFEQELDLTKTLPFIERFNAGSPHKLTLFHVFLWAAVKALSERPRLNRFVAGAHIYQREGIWISYSAKKSLSDDAPIVVLKRRFDPAATLPELLEFLMKDLSTGRSDKKSYVDKELGFFLRLPSPLLRLILRLQRWLDAWNLLPGAFMRTDPLYASLFIANLGSVKLESAYHHLYEYGNIPLFATIGRRKQVAVFNERGEAVPRTICSVKYSFDERIEDGLYCAQSLDRLKQLVEDPQRE